MKSKNQQIMILGNPAYWRDSFLRMMLSVMMLCLYSFTLHSQGVEGMVLEHFSRQPVKSAEVRISFGDADTTRFLTDEFGKYIFHTSKAGRIQISITAAGYASYLMQDIILDGYASHRIIHLLEQSSFSLPGVTVVADQRKTSPFVRSITPDDMVLIAGNFEDPVRIAHSQPGIILLNDQSNQLSARGLSPVFNTWYLEGLEIVNPNHTSNAGTFSDLPTQYGGGVNMFSAQALGTTDVYLGLNPLHIDNTNGATIDMHLLESAKPEWRAKAGLIGFELGGGISMGAESMLDMNMRYSFTGLLTGLGVDFGGEKIGFYDGVISYKKSGPKHQLKLFAWGGKSKNEFDRVAEAEERERFKDFFDIDYHNDILGAGGRYDAVLSPSLGLRSGLSFSTNKSTHSRQGQFESTTLSVKYNDQIAVISSFIELSIRHSNRIHTSGGIQYVDRSYPKWMYSIPVPERSLVRPYLNTTIRLSPAWQLELGGDLTQTLVQDRNSLDPGYRAILKWNYGHTGALIGGFRHGTGNDLSLSPFAQLPNQFFNDQFELGWNLSAEKNTFGVDVYYHQISRMTVYELADGFFHPVDYPYQYYRSESTGLSPDGQAYFYGIEGHWEYNDGKGLRSDINQSVFQSKRSVDGQQFLPGRYHGVFATHASVAKEFISEKNGKSRILNISMRALIHGGLWEESIDPEASEDYILETVFTRPGIFDQQLPIYKRIDLSFARTIGYAKVRWRYSLDIQNVFGFTNIAYHYYDPFLKEIIAQKQLSIIPVLSVQASW